MKKVFAMILCLLLCFSMAACSLGNVSIGSGSNNIEKVEEFYDLVSESQELLDDVADDIYRNWYDAIYNDKFGGNINTAIARALSANSSNVDKIEELDEEIGKLFKEVKDTEQGDLIKAVMSAYSDYYEFVINVSGSFNSFSENKEDLKKELASALKELSFEL